LNFALVFCSSNFVRPFARKHVDEIEQRWWEETAEGRAVSGQLPAPAGGNPIKEI